MERKDQMKLTEGQRVRVLRWMCVAMNEESVPQRIPEAFEGVVDRVSPTGMVYCRDDSGTVRIVWPDECSIHGGEPAETCRQEGGSTA